LSRSGSLSTAIVLFAGFGVLAIHAGLQLPRAVAQQSAATPKLVHAPDLPLRVSNAAADIPLPGDVTPPGSLRYLARPGDSVAGVAHRLLSQTSYLTSIELAEAIRGANGEPRLDRLRAGQAILVPGILPAPIVEDSIPVTRDFEVRAIYLTGLMAGSERGLGIIRRWKEAGGNAVVFDVKDSDGKVNIPFADPLAGEHAVTLHDLPKFTRFLHSEGMHTIARIAVFRDEHLVLNHPELAVKSRKTGQPWRENGKLVWTDPSQPLVQQYVIALAKKVAQAGADEIQFDYVRFPAEGDQTDASFLFETTHPGWRRSQVIADFLQHAYQQIHAAGPLLSLDVFGIMAWQRPVDLAHTGQDIVAMAQYCDVLSPMIYPSHFFGMDGIAHPGDAPEHFIGESMDRFVKITQGSGVVIRPWLQAFAWRTRTYSPKYIEAQVLTAKNKGGIGFLFWNANNDYSKPYAAMPEMMSAKGEFLRGDKLPRNLSLASTHPGDSVSPH